MDRVIKFVVRGDVSDAIGKVKALSSAVSATAKSMTDSSKEAQAFRRNLSSVGDSAGRLGLAATAGLGAIILTTAKFDKQMSAVQAATHETAASMADLRKAAIDAGASTAFSASEAAQGIEELAKAGVSTKDILAGGLAGSLDLAAAGALGVGDAAEIAATAMTQFSLGGDKVGHVADLLSAGAGKAQGSVQDLGMALNQSGLVASQTGLTIEETTGTLAAFASAGLIGSDSGTSFKTMLQSLTPSGAKAANEMERLGISAYDAQGNFVGMVKFADSLKDGLKDLSVEQQNAALKTIFGSDAVRAASVIFQQGGEGIQSWIDKVDDSGYAAETAKTRLSNLAGDMEALKGALETALIGAGEGSTGPLRELVQGVTGAINVFNKLPGPVKSSATAMLAVTAVLGGGLWFSAKAISGVATMRTNMAALGVSSRITAISMGNVAKSMGLLGTALIAVDSGSDIVDSFKRTTGAASETSSSFAKLKKNLEGSNVGKYANDFGIDINKLAVDIARFGDKGEYYAKVTDKMGAANDGFGGKAKQLGNFLTPWIGETEKAGLASLDLRKILDKTSVGMEVTGQSAKDAAAGNEEFGSSATGAGKSAKKSAEDIAAAQEALDKAREAALSTSMSFFDFSRDAKQSFGDYLDQLEKSAAAYRDFTENALVASDKGLDGGLIDQLKAQGPEGMLALQDFANASEKEIKRANNAFRDTSGLSELEAELSLLPKDVITEFKTAGAPGAIEQAAKVAQRYEMSPKLVETLLKAKDYTKADIKAVLARLAELNGTTAEPSIRVKGAGAAVTAAAAVKAALASIPGLTETTIRTVKETYTAKSDGPKRSVKDMLKATGGDVSGPGTGTSDSIPAWLSNGEHVLTAAEVQKAGGQGAIYRMRAAIRSGSMPAFASGGAVEPPSKLEIKQQEKTVRDIERSLAEREKFGKKPKKGKDTRPTRNVLRGLDRQIALLELQEAKQDLRDLKSGKEVRRDRAEKAREAAEKAEQEALDLADKAESARLSAKDSYGQNFKLGAFASAASLERNLDRTIADASTFMGLLGDLKRQGASPWLLAQLVDAGPTRSAIKLAREYATDSAKLASINAKASQIDAITNSYAGLITNPLFMAAGAWNSGITAGPQVLSTQLAGVKIELGTDGFAHFVQGQIITTLDGAAQEARFAIR